MWVEIIQLLSDFFNNQFSKLKHLILIYNLNGKGNYIEIDQFPTLELLLKDIDCIYQW